MGSGESKGSGARLLSLLRPYSLLFAATIADIEPLIAEESGFSVTEAMTAPVAVVNFMNYEGWEWGKIAAGGSLVMAPVLIFSLAVRRYLVSGLTAGAVKG